jgi:hypothetical protein
MVLLLGQVKGVYMAAILRKYGISERSSVKPLRKMEVVYDSFLGE